MFDYKLLAALAAVVEQAGFERAAQALGLSQSAISQRIKLLEARVGQPVLLRDTPPRPTELGQRLLNHVQQVRLLERDLQDRSRRWMKTACRNACVSPSMPTPWRHGGRVQWRRSAPRTGCCSITWWKIRRSGSSACAQGRLRPASALRSDRWRVRAASSSGRCVIAPGQPAFIERHFQRGARAADWDVFLPWCSARTTSCSIATWRRSAGRSFFTTCAHRRRALCACYEAGSAGVWHRSFRCVANLRVVSWSMCCPAADRRAALLAPLA